MLSVEVLGGFRLVVDGAPIELRGIQRRRVAALLSAHAPLPVATTVLAACLDPGARSANPANAVQAHIRRLRSAIEPGVPGTRSTRLPAIGDGYAMVPDRMDLWDLRSTVDDVRTRRGVDPAGAARLMGAALDRWGTPWGALGEDELLSEHRWSLGVEHLGLEDEWSELVVRAGADPASCDRIVELARSQPTREHRAANAMQALFQVGRQADALRLYDHVREELRDTLGVSPGPELDAMHLRVLRHDPTLRVRPLRVLGLPPRIRVDSLVGRDELVRSLDELVGRHRIVNVVGPAGVGTTRLVEHWMTSVCAADSAIWIDVLGAVDGLDPALGDALGVGESDEVDGRGESARRALPRGPTVVVLDGAEHRLDEVSTSVLELVGARPALHVVVTSKGPLDLPGEQLLVVPPLGFADGAVVGSGEAAVELAADRLGPGASPELVRRTAHRAGGLPLAIELEAGASFGLPVPTVESHAASLVDVVHAAVLRLSPAARTVLALASALPDGVGLDAAKWHCDRWRDPTVADPHEHRRLLGELVRSQLIEVRHGERGTRYLARPQVAPVVGESDGPVRAGDAATANVEWICHLAGSGAGLAPLVPDAARRSMLRAEARNVAAALATLRDRDAGEHVELLVALVPQLGRLPERSRVRREIDLARALDPTPLDDARLLIADSIMVPDMAGVASRAAELRAALEVLEASSVATEWLVGARVVNAIASGWSGDLDGAGSHLEVARDAAREVPSDWMAAVVDRYLSVFRLVLGEPAEAVAIAVDAADRLVAVGDPIEALGALHFAATASWSVPQVDTAALLDRAERIADTSDSVFEPLLRAERARYAVSIGAPDRDELLELAASSLEAGGQLRTAAVTRRRLGLLHLAEGRRVAARDELMRAAEALLALDPAGAA
ncbi:MAG: hypothetical protein M3Y51_11560, partial [Actinomycetota bacterium]|nr:hypothetical protein [Actinomycetota bacterium]